MIDDLNTNLVWRRIGLSEQIPSAIRNRVIAMPKRKLGALEKVDADL